MTILSIIGWVFASVIFLSLAAFGMVLFLKAKREGKTRKGTVTIEGDKKDGQIGWPWKQWSIIFGGIVVLNLVLWAIPWLWAIVAHKWYILLLFDLGLAAVLYLRTIKDVDKDGKEVDKKNTTAGILASIITLALVVVLATTAKSVWTKGSPAKEALIEAVGGDHPLVAIAGCVSNFRQFEIDSKTPYIGPGGGIGIFQIPPQAADVAGGLGMNVREIDGNIKYAVKEFNHNGVALWLMSGSPGELACWSSRLEEFFASFVLPKGGISGSVPMLSECCQFTAHVSPDGVILRSDKEETIIHNSIRQDFVQTVKTLAFESPEKEAEVVIKFFRRK